MVSFQRLFLLALSLTRILASPTAIKQQGDLGNEISNGRRAAEPIPVPHAQLHRRQQQSGNAAGSNPPDDPFSAAAAMLAMVPTWKADISSVLSDIDNLITGIANGSPSRQAGAAEADKLLKELLPYPANANTLLSQLEKLVANKLILSPSPTPSPTPTKLPPSSKATPSKPSPPAGKVTPPGKVSPIPSPASSPAASPPVRRAPAPPPPPTSVQRLKDRQAAPITAINCAGRIYSAHLISATLNQACNAWFSWASYGNGRNPYPHEFYNNENLPLPATSRPPYAEYPIAGNSVWAGATPPGADRLIFEPTSAGHCEFLGLITHTLAQGLNAFTGCNPVPHG